MSTETFRVLERTAGWKFIDFDELREYKDLLYFLTWRNIKVLYAQTVLGLLWAIIQPVVQIVLFTIIFGKIARIPTEGIPYVLFSTVAIVPWTYISGAMQESSQSLVLNQGLLGKLYLPRLIFPLVPILSRMVDFTVSMVIILGTALYYRVLPTVNLIFFPIFVLMMMAISLGVGLWLSSLTIRFRDVRHAMGFVLRMLMYSAPIVYSVATVDPTYRFVYSLNPLVGVIEGFRATLLGTSMPWAYIWPGMVSTVLLVVGGAFYFKRMERIFADVI
ncbi:transport permease protein [Desulfosarcina ovata subsp. sediminis]|uniref:Transport permease protein n=1 Tax=Desulfosarcina ovata subsp. sediminis TaxID=885957 RepID=A0A5K7ZNJ4_9BACT|nr:ABC transporter permease [Desulfosarcina ovata]BBO82781.1 transport permease protein [Desulfosarcina ovata subsp. sediminis]